MVNSSDFSGGILDEFWLIEGPSGTAVRLATSATDAFLELVTPDGSHDVWQTNNGARALQATADTDFQLSAKFLSTPSQKYQLQGFLIEQDAQNWIRLDTYFDGSSLRAFGAVTVNGSSSAKFNLAIPGNVAPYLQMTRSGDLWSLEYSTDGASWVTAGSFTHAMTVTAAGLFAGNTGAATGFTAQVDWFENTASPIVDEDGTITLPNDPPTAIDDSYELDLDGSLVVSAGDGVLRNDVDPDEGALAVVLDRSPAHGTVTLNGDGSFTYSANPDYVGPDDFTYVVSDDLGASATATVTLKAANIPPQIITGTSSFTKVVVDNAMPLTHIALAADFDLDGDLDIVATAEGTDTVAWFENDGSLSFTRHDIDTNLESAYPASLADLDLDGDMDVLVGGYRADQYVWYENNGAGGFSKRVIASQDGAHSIFAVDMDGDGDFDLITAGQDSNRISWFENDGTQSFTERLIDDAAMAAKSAVAVDLDNDGDIDVVSASYADDTIAWYENDGTETFTKRIIDTAANGAYFATAADLDGDGDLDIVSASQLDNSIAWYRNDGGVFTKALISGSAIAARYVSAIDMDGDGDVDVLSASVDDNTIALYLNDGLGNFDRIVADDAAIGAYGAVPIDMNGDGLKDILGASKADGIISVLLQEKAHEVSLAPGENLAIGTELLNAIDDEQSAATLVYTLIAAPTLGQLEVDGEALSRGATFTQSDIDTGRLSYQQTGSVEGEDYFRLSLSDGLAPASTASFTLTIGDPPPASDLVSDDFSNGVLDPAWNAVGPAGTAVRLATSATDAFLELVTPDGSHDVWQTNNGARALQATADTDFQLEARFLTTPSQKYQLQGFLIEQDAQNWIRLDTYFDGVSLRAFGAVTVNGSSSAKFNLAIPGNAAPYLQMTRSGDLWSLEYSTDGASWVTAGSFTHAMTVTAAGLFAGNTGAAAGFTAQVDWFENTASPIVDEDGTITPVNYAPVAGDDALATDQDTPLLIDVAADLLANDSDSNGDTLSVTAFTQPGTGTLTDNGDGTLSYTPAAGYNGADSFTYTVSDGAQTDTATVNLTVGSEAPPPASSFVSDDFSNGVLDPAWNAVGPAGTAVRLATSATDAFLELVTPDGSHDVWQTNNGARALQATADTDFQLEARFLTTPSQKYQLQGFLIEQDAQNWIRLDTYFDGVSLRAFGAVTVNGSSSAKFNLAIPGNAAPYLQMTRSGDLWSLEYSTDGASWVTAGSFTHAMTVTAAGLFAGNTGAAAGFTAQVDWFENTASPIVDEDGTITPVNYAPVAGDDALATDQDTPLLIDVAADLLANDSDSNGDTLSVTAFTQPGTGTLTDNGDGTLSYTPAAGYNGADSFTYTVSDGAQTDTATVNLTVGSEAPPPASSFVSDDFSNGVLDPAWNAVGPAGTAVRLATSATDAFLELVTPDGSHDVWQTNNGARALQATADTDFQLEARFLTTPSQKYQLQGFLIEQDAQNWIRLDTYFDGVSLRAFGAVTVNGSSSAKFNLAIPGNAAPYLQMTRSGDLWSLEYSTDGASWVTAGSFTHAMTVTAAGLFAGNTGAAAGFTAQVDWFENTASPIVDEDGTITPVNYAPVAGDDALATDQDTPLLIDVAADLLANDSDSNGDTLSVTAFTQPGTGTLTDNGDGTLSYTPAAGYNGADSFTYTVSDGAQTDTATVNLTVGSEAPPPASSFVSDDFSNGVLDPAWNAVGPAGTAVRLATSATDAFLELVTPDGSHDVWQTNNGARALQATADTDFQLEARFLTTPSQKYQLQGFLIEQDAQNWIRLDTYFDGVSLRAFGAVTVNGSSSAKFNLAIPGNAAPYLQMTRSGDLWSLEYSTDGASWVTAGSFTHAMTVTAAGLFAGNTGAAAGFTAQVDWFENTASPIVDEDGTITPVNYAPVAGDDALATDQDTPLLIDVAADLLANDSDSNGDTLSVTAFTQPGTGTLTDNGDGTLSYTPAAGYNGADSFTYTVSDGAQTDTATVNLTVGSEAPPPASSFVSDDFSNGVLDPAWNAVGPAGTAVRLATSATDAFLELVTPDGSHDVWQTNNGARALQATADTDFQLEARFLTTPSQKYQLQGFLIEQDAQNWIRLDTYFDGVSLRAFGAVTVNGSSSAKFNLAIPGNAAPYLQMTRSGDLWSLEYSTDGASWVTAGSFTHAMTVTAAGLFAGNTGAAAGFTAQVDWFENTASPIVDEDGTITPVNYAPVAGDDALATDQDTPLLIDVAADLLANDSDSNGDTLSVTAFTQPGTGTLTDNGDGTLSYTPAAGYNGADSFTYTVSDGAQTDTATVNLTVGSEAPPPASSFVSDDFSNGVLDPAWNAVGPAGTAVRLATSATDAFLELVTPDGSHDVWQTNNGARALQATADTDFQLEARFLTTPSQKYQLQGFLIEQDAQNWIRLDTYFDGVSLRAFGAVTVNGSSSAKFNLAIPGNAAPYLQMTRSGDLWSLEYSTDGASWVTAGSFTHAMTVTAAGLFAGNTGAAAGFTAQVDWFENTASPIVDEDATITPVNVAPVAGDDALATDQDTPLLIDVAADLLANDSDSNGDTLSVTAFTQPGTGTLTDNGDGTLSYTPAAGYNGADSFTYTVSDGAQTDTATVNLTVGNPIHVWYGPEQSFGMQGEAQVWVNVTGNVTGDVTSLSYSLNGGAAQALSIGPDTRRLHDNGDFNVEIAYSDLDGSATDDVVTITAQMVSGETYTREVRIDYEDGAVWSQNYSIDWSTVTDIQQVVQVIDGTWAVLAGGLRPVDLGYDRVVALGDQSWDNYELRLSVTTHDLRNIDPSGRDGGGFAIGMLWNGHTDDPVAGFQPRAGWEPGAAVFYEDGDADGNGRLQLYPSEDFFNRLDSQSINLSEDTTYELVVRVEQVGLYDRQFSSKIWEQGTFEPVGWNVQGVQSFDLSDRPATGSIYLNAHYFDVAFNNLTVTEITGRDIVQGTEQAEIQVAVDANSAMPGAGEIDVFVGDLGADVFVFGEAGTVYYDDGIAGESGMADYGFVWDFVSGVDQVQLAGNAADYNLTENHPGLTAGTAIWRVGEGGDVDELIGLLNGVFGLSLSDTDFVYSDALWV